MPDLPDLLVALGWVTIGCAAYAIHPVGAMGYVGVSLCVFGMRLHKHRARKKAG